MSTCRRSHHYDVSTLPMSVDAPRPRGRPPRTDRQRAARRGLLVDAAMDAVRALGPEVSIDQMADAAEVSKPVLYSEFGDKNGLVDTMAVVLAERIEQRVVEQAVAAGRYDPGTIIGIIIESLINLIDDEPHLYAYIVRSLRMRDRGLLDNALVRVIRDRATLLLGLLGEGLMEDDLEVMTAGVFGFVFGVVESWVETRRPDKAELIATVTAVIEAGLAQVTARRAAR